MEKPDKLFEDSNIESLKPDFVLSCFYSFNHKVDQATKAANADLDRLLEVLISNGFLIQIRPGKGVDHILVFIRLGKQALVEAIKKSKVNDYLFGVNHDIFDDIDTLDDSDKLRIVYNLLIDDIGLTPKFGAWQFVEAIQPIHDANFGKQLLAKWAKKYRIDEEDIDSLKQEYGTNVALYFAFLKFYLTWLVFPATIGLVNFGVFKYQFSVVYTFLNLIWAVFFIQAWKQKEKNYALKWNVKNIDASTLQINNTFFKSELLTEDYVTNKKTHKYYGSYKRLFKKLAFIPVAVLFGVLLIAWQFVVFFVEIFITEFYDGPGKSVLGLVPTAMLSVFVPIFTLVYKKVVTIVVAWENHRTILSYQNSVNEKMFIVSFLTSYLALIITSFIYYPFGHLVNDYVSTVLNFVFLRVHPDFPLKADHFVINPKRMNGQFFFAIVTNQIVNFVLEYFIPLGQRLWKQRKTDVFFDYNDAKQEVKYLEAVRKQVYDLDDYDVNADYRQMVVQFGYLLFFSQSWTIAPLICLVVNITQFFGDATKIFLENKRPIPTRTNSIYPWNQFLDLITWASTIVAPAITGMYRNSSNILGGVSVEALKSQKFSLSSVSIKTWSLLTIIIVSEHLYLVLSYTLLVLFNKLNYKAAQQDLKESIALKKKFISKNFDKSSIVVAEDVDGQWLKLDSNNQQSLIRLATKVTENVKQTTRVKHTDPEPAAKPQAPVETGSVSEKPAQSGPITSGVEPSGSSVSQRKPIVGSRDSATSS